MKMIGKWIANVEVKTAVIASEISNIYHEIFNRDI